MRGKTRSLMLVLLVLLLSFTTTGCWNRAELDRLSFVSAMAFDRGTDNQIRLTAQLVDVGSIKSPEGSGKPGNAFFTLSSSGDTVFAAVRNFVTKSGRKLYFPHMMLVVFGGDLAREGVRPELDWLVRDHEIRLLTRVLVTDGKAADIVSAESEPESIPAQHLNMMLEQYGAVSKTVDCNLSVLYNSIYPFEQSAQGVVGRVELSGTDTSKPNRFLLSGAGAFHEDKLVGWLNPVQTRGYLWLCNKVKSGIISVPAPNGQNRLASLDIIGSSCKVTPCWDEGEMKYTVNVKVESDIGENMGTGTLTPQAISQLEEEQSQKVQGEIEAVIKAAQQDFKSDILGLGEVTMRKCPEQWKEMQGEWNRIFPQCSVQVIVKSKIRNTGLIN